MASLYDKAASAILDKLWEDYEFRDFFYDLGYELADLGPLIHDVFVPAYLGVKRRLEGGALEMLEAQVTQDLLSPLYDRPNFREMWEQWDQPTRDAFLREQSEMQLGLLLVMVYESELREAYKDAFLIYLG
ncbi:MAG: hypothetical protein GYB65_17840 [Chloroflexi bacterium]|nr:hypothetical protein [Chloroflexota bacterium]